MLPQPLLIFRKDLQHLWPETLVVVALFVAFCFAAPSGWAGSEFVGYVSIIAGFLKYFLMPVSWLVVIARLIQDEPLVGDRQFWTSRPYHWAQLFAAKVLYLLVFLYLPFFLMQVYLLKHAGLHPILVLPALLHNLLLLTVILVIPIMAISAVTSTFARVLLTVVGVFVAAIILVAVLGYLTFLNMTPPHLDWIASALFIVLPALALLYQYKTRKTAMARMMLIATPVVAILVYLLAPTTSMIAHAYPVAPAADTPKLTAIIRPDVQPPHATGELATTRDHVQLRLPVQIAGADDKNDYIVEGDRVAVTASGLQYSSPFTTSPGIEINGARPFTIVTFYLPLKVFNQIHNAPADLHLDLASQHLAAQDPTTWKATSQPFSVPGNGICAFSSPQDAVQQPTCRYPFAPPEINFVNADLSPGQCGSDGGQKVPGRANLGGKPAPLAFDPVVAVPLSFQTGDPNPARAYQLCPGTDLKFLQAKTLASVTIPLEVKGVVLDPYVLRRGNSQERAPAVQAQPE